MLIVYGLSFMVLQVEYFISGVVGISIEQILKDKNSNFAGGIFQK